MPFKDECEMCGRVLPYSYLKRCQRCRQLFCRDCVVPDVSTGDPTRMFCLNCARRIVSPKSTTKYGALTSYLRFRGTFTSVVKLSFAKIDGIVSDNLPMSAYRHEKWWNNSPNSTHAKAWLDAGWKTQEVNLKEGYVVFRRVRTMQTKGLRRKISLRHAEKPFTPVPVHVPKTRKLSKTKATKLYARLKNIERRKASMSEYHGSFKPKPMHEKKLFKSGEKPK